MSKITTIGFYNYDNTLFDSLNFPPGIDKQTAVNEILMRSGEFEVLYSDLDFLKLAIEQWGKKHYRTFEKWIEALSEEFNPLHNYDRHEVYTDTKLTGRNDSRAYQEGEKDKRKKDDNSFSQTFSEHETNDGNTTETSAYDATDYQPKQNEYGGEDGFVHGLGNGSNSSDENGERNLNVVENTGSTGNELIQHEAHLYGNIGVTTSTQMLEDFIRVERFSIYEAIADIYVDEMCIMIY